MRDIHYQCTVEETIAAAIASMQAARSGERVRELMRTRSYATYAVLSISFGLLIGLMTPRSVPERVISGTLAVLLFFGLSLLGKLVMRVVLLPKGTGLATDRQHALIERLYREGRQPAYAGSITVRLTDEGLATASEIDRCLHLWPAVQGAACSPRHVMIRLALCQFIAVPLTAFADAGEAEEFAGAINRLCRRALTEPGTPTPPTQGVR